MGIEFPWWFVFVIIGYSAQWWAGAALLTATLPRGRIGWLRRLALATLGVILTYAVTTVGFWIHAEVFRGGWRGQLAWQRALVVLNAIAAIIALWLMASRSLQRRNRRRNEQQISE